MGINTSIYLSQLQFERLQAMAQADSRSVSNLVGLLVDAAWAEYLAQRDTLSPTDLPEHVLQEVVECTS